MAEIHALDSHHCLAQAKGLIIQCWRNTPVAAVDDNIAHLSRIFAAGPAGFATIVIMDPESPPPDAPARKRLDALANLVKAHASCAAYVYEGSGFKAAAMRGVLMALMLVGRNNIPYKICATVPDALNFLGAHLQDDERFGSAAERAKAIEGVRVKFAATRA